jgi:transposase
MRTGPDPAGNLTSGAACATTKRAFGRPRIEFGVRPNTVGLWRKRFAAAGLAGLRDRARPGKTAKYGADLRLRVLRQLELPPPKGLASWDGASLAAALGASDDAVWRLLRREGVQLRRRRSWCVSTDPQFCGQGRRYYRPLPEPAGKRAGLERRSCLVYCAS